LEKGGGKSSDEGLPDTQTKAWQDRQDGQRVTWTSKERRKDGGKRKP